MARDGEHFYFAIGFPPLKKLCLVQLPLLYQFIDFGGV
jgi:hypothetical protein